MRGLGLSFSDTVREVSASPMSRIFFFDDPASDRYFWKMFAAGIVLLVAMTGLDQDMMQRNLSCATPRDSQKNIVLTAVSQIFVIFLFLVLGVLLYLYMECSGLTPPAKSDQVFSLVAVDGGLPLVVGILFVVGLISSTYSAAGSALTALTTSFTVDILEAHETLRRGASHASSQRGSYTDGAGHGRRDPRFRILGRRQRYQPGL